MRKAFYKWRVSATHKRLEDEFLSQGKASARDKLGFLFRKAKDKNLAFCIHRWKAACTRRRILRMMSYRIINISNIRKQQAFDIWRDVVGKKRLTEERDASELMRKISRLYLRTLKEGFDSLKAPHRELITMKNKAISRILLTCQSQISQAFTLWRMHTKHLQQIESCASVAKFLLIAAEVHRRNVSTVLSLHRSDENEKRALFIKLIFAQSKKTRQAFYRWVEATLGARKKEIELTARYNRATETLNGKLLVSNRDALKEAFSIMKAQMKAAILKKRIIRASLRNDFGLLQDAFQRWYDAAKRFKLVEEKKKEGPLALSFQRMYLRQLRTGFEQLKGLIAISNEQKRSAMRRMIAIARGGYGEGFTHWKEIAEMLRCTAAARQLLTFFEVTNAVVSGNLKTALNIDSRAEKKQLIVK